MDLILRLAWRNIWRNRRRSLLTLLAIAFGVILLIFNIGIQLGSYDVMIENTVRLFHGHIQVQRKGYLDNPRIRKSIPAITALAARLRDQLGSKAVAARATGFALISSRSRSFGVMVVGVEPKYEPEVSSIPGTIRQGRYFKDASANEAIIGISLAKNLKIKIGDELTLLGSGRDGSVAATVIPVVGIFNSGSRDLDRSQVQLPIQTFQDIFTMQGQGHSIVLWTKKADQISAMLPRLKQLIPKDQDLVLLPWEKLLPGIKELIELDFASGWFIYITLIVIITFSILNTFLMSVLERTREFGLMLALGYTPLRIGALVMLEALMLTLLGIAVGLIIGACINTYFYIYGFSIPGMEEIAAQLNLPSSIQPKMSFYVFSAGPLVVLIATMLAALYPALRIRLLKPVDAMRSV
jgi:ABC-type lipoprotein release transport system permease subunit